jgi:hypothetical protein
MATIHRLLCTHCTFGTSALESSTADNASKVFGNSVRRSSLPNSERGQLRTVFRAVERMLSYYLPKDAPAEKKESLDAYSTPRRLVFLPNLGGWQAVAHVAYRTRDTAGRPGCYFADVLAAKVDATKAPWSPLDILQLWSTGYDDAPRANWWCVSEEALAELDESGQGELRSVGSPAELRGNAEPFLEENLLNQFLTLEPGSAPDDPGRIVSPRWWEVPAPQRRALVEAMLNATINVRKTNGKEIVAIAAEPSVASLLFYAVCRLLPEKLRTGIGFSTYESSPERSLTPLVATTFLDHQASNADLPAELYSRGFACNTFENVTKYGRSQPVAEVGYVRHVVALAAAANWVELNGFLAALDALQRPDFGSLDKMTEIETYVSDYLTANKRRKKVGAEPPVERASDKERFRRARFRGFLATGVENGTGDWPSDLLRTAVAWLGDEFPTLWNEQGPVAAVLQTRLPASNKELELLLKKVQDAPESTRVRLTQLVARAVDDVALAERAEQIPQAFANFIAPPTKDGSDSTPTAKAGDFVEALVSELVAKGRQHLLRNPSRQLVGPILDAVYAMEKRVPGFVLEQQIPLLDILTWSLSNTHTSTKDRAGLLARHSALESLTRRSVYPRDLTVAVDDFFRKLLRLVPGTKQNHWDFLAAGGRSRIDALRKWLSAVKPENKSRYNEVLDAWQAIHEAVSDLNPVAKKATRFKALFPKLFPGEQPPGDSLKKFRAAYGQLREIHQDCNTPIDPSVAAFLATFFSGLDVDESERPTITRWLERYLNDAIRANKSASAKLRRKKKPSIMGAAVRVGIPAASVLVCAGLAFVFYPKVISHPAIRHLFAAKSAAKEGKRVETKRTEIVETDPKKSAGDSTGDPLSSGTTPSVQPNGSDKISQPPTPLSKETLALTASIKSGTLAIRWNGDAVKQSGETIKFRVTPDKEVVHPPSPTGKNSVDIALTTYGDYSVTAEATDSTGIPRKLDTWGPTTFAPPSAPAISSTEVLVNPEGKPVLRVTIKQPDLSAYRTCVYRLTDPAGVIGEAPADRSEAQECNVQIPLGDRKPADVRGLRFSIRVITAAGDGKPTDLTPLEPPTNVVETLRAKLEARKKHGVYVCALPDAYPTEPVTILELPWFLDDRNPSIQLDLLSPRMVSSAATADTSCPVLSAVTESLSKWKCSIKDSVEAGAVIGWFEIVRSMNRPWCPVLEFRPSPNANDNTKEAYARLRTCKLGFRVPEKPVGTAQLIEPRQMGPLTVAINKPIDKLGYAVPRLLAPLDPAAIPPALLPQDTKPRLPFVFCTPEQAGRKGECTVSLGPPDSSDRAKSAYKARIGIAKDDIEMWSGLMLIRRDRPTMIFHNEWKWPRTDSDGKQKTQPVEADLPNIHHNVATYEQCKTDAEKAAANAKRAAEAADSAKDEKQKQELLQKKKAAEADEAEQRARLENLRASYASDKPYDALIDAFTTQELHVPNWTIQWDVVGDPGTVFSAEIPGTLTVVGVAGSKEGGAPLSFKPDPDWKPKKKK